MFISSHFPRNKLYRSLTVIQGLLILLLILMESAEQSRGENNENARSQKVFSYKGKCFTFTDITGMSAQDVRKAIVHSARFYKPGETEGGNWIMGIGMKGFDNHTTDATKALNDYVTAVTNLTIKLFVSAKISDSIRTMYPNLCDDLVNEEAIPVYETKYAHIICDHQKLSEKILEGDITLVQYYEKIGLHVSDNWLSYYRDQFRRNTATTLINMKVFPPLVNGMSRVAPWFKWRTKASYLVPQIVGLVRLDKDRWVSKLEKLRGEQELKELSCWDSLFISNVPTGEFGRKVATKLLDMIVDKSGRVAVGGIWRINSILNRIGLDMHIRYNPSLPFMAYKRNYGIDVSKVPLRQPILLSRNNGGVQTKNKAHQKRDLLYVIRRRKLFPNLKRKKQPEKEILGIPRSVVQYARPFIIREFSPKVLKDLSCFAPYSKPSIKDMEESAGRLGFLRSFGNEKLPAVLRFQPKYPKGRSDVNRER